MRFGTGFAKWRKRVEKSPKGWPRFTWYVLYKIFLSTFELLVDQAESLGLLQCKNADQLADVVTSVEGIFNDKVRDAFKSLANAVPIVCKVGL